MNKITEAITVSTQVYPTSTTAKSGSSAVDLSQYKRAVAKLYAHRLPDAKGEGVITLSIYENTSTTPTRTIISARVVTGSITSSSDFNLQSEISADALTNGKKFISAYVTSSTATQVAVTIDRGQGRYEKV